jgi:hypothetical protein
MREAEMLKLLQKRISELLPQAKVRWVVEPPLNGGGRPDAVADLRIAGNRLKLVFELQDNALLGHLGRQDELAFPAQEFFHCGEAVTG